MALALSETAKRRVRLALVFLAAFGVQFLLRKGLLSGVPLPRGMLYPLVMGYGITLYVSMLIVILSFVGRALGMRKGSWALAGRYLPTLVHKVLHWVPGGLWFLFTGVLLVKRSLPALFTGHAPAWLYGQEAGALLAALGMTALARFAIKRATSAKIEAEPPSAPLDPTETIFSAVAVTNTTRSLVVLLAILPVAFVTAMIQIVSIGQAGVAAAVAAYVATTFGSIAVLRRVSRIKVGIDGVYVMGSGPARFYAWSSVDAVKFEGVDIVLRRRDKVVLRLQLHDTERSQSDALVARFAEAMANAERARNDASHVHAAHAVSAAAAGNDRFLASTHGASDYRQAAVPREQLWEVVEGAAAEPSARVLAAEALATTAMDRDERARLRVAAEHCAEPKVRVALEQLLDDDDAVAAADEKVRPLTFG